MVWEALPRIAFHRSAEFPWAVGESAAGLATGMPQFVERREVLLQLKGQSDEVQPRAYLLGFSVPFQVVDLRTKKDH